MKKIILLFILNITFINYLFSQKVIEMKYENGIYTIPCKVNGVPMKFIFDTGASDVSISLTEAKFLIKQGLLSDNDIKGKVRYKIANGDIEVGTKINLKEISIDGFILKNVEASIVNQLNAPLLLGQSAISKLGTFQVDGNKLIVRDNKIRDYSTFLNVDFNKTYSDYGFLQAGINRGSLNGYKNVKLSLISKQKHFLSELKFDEFLTFNMKGNVEAVILFYHLDNIKDSQKKEKIKEKYSITNKKLEEKFGFPSFSSNKKSEWKHKNYHLVSEITNNFDITIYYNFVDSEITKDNQEEKKDSRIYLENFINENFYSFTKQKNPNSREFVRVNKNNFEHHHELKIGYKGSQKEAQKINNGLSFIKMRYTLFLTEENKQLFLDGDFDFLVFKLYLTDKYHKKFLSEIKISKTSIKNLKMPFTENEVLNILEK